jgi:uncharacterized protein YfkK (UPF0435 family)
MMKRCIVILLSVFISTTLCAQSYNITDASQRINNKKYAGVSSLVEGSIEKVEAFWLSYLKESGKVRRKRNYYQLDEFSVKDMANDTITYYTRVEAKDSSSLIWIGPLNDGLNDEEVQSLNSDNEKILKLATRGFYVDLVQQKIDQSEDAAIFVSKNHQKLIYNGETLVQDSIATQTLKAELQAKLEETELKIKVLNQQIIDNKAAVLTTYEDLEKIKKVIEGHKRSLKEIN